MTMAEIMEALKSGGFTDWLHAEQFTGYLVGGACEGSKFDSIEHVTARDVIEIIVRASGVADAVGGWVDENGEVYLDGNTWHTDLNRAIRIARARGERAIWDVANRKEIYV